MPTMNEGAITQKIKNIPTRKRNWPLILFLLPVEDGKWMSGMLIMPIEAGNPPQYTMPAPEDREIQRKYRQIHAHTHTLRESSAIWLLRGEY